MALLALPKNVRMLEYDSVDLLPSLEEDVFFDDIDTIDLEEMFTASLEDWWGGFVSDMYL